MLKPEYLATLPISQLPYGVEHLEGPRENVTAALVHGITHRRIEQVTRVYPLPEGRAYVRVKRLQADPATYRAARPAWQRRSIVAAIVTVPVVGVFAGVAYVVRTMTSAVREGGPALGFVLAVAALLLIVAALRRRSGRTVTVRTVTTTRVRVR